MVRAISFVSVGLGLVNANPEIADEPDIDDVADMEVTMLQLKTDVTTKKVVKAFEKPASWSSAEDDIRAMLLEYGYDEDDVSRAATSAALYSEADDRRKAALHFLSIEAKPGPSSPQKMALAQVNRTGNYFDDSGQISLWDGGRFLGPLWNSRCQGSTHHRSGDVHSCASQCEDMSCKAFSMNGGSCELYSDCHAVTETGGFMMYVRNVEGIEPHRLPTRHVGGSSATFFVTGDWGGSTSPDRASMHYVRKHHARGSPAWNEDHYAQDNVARRMGEVGRQRPPSFVVNAGDNFYWGGIDHWHQGGHGVHDRNWRIGFEDMYTDPTLKVPWISIMGNHDFGGVGCFADMGAQYDYTAKDLLLNDRWKMPSPYYSHKIDFDGFSLELFMIDTNMEDAHFGARGGGVCRQQICLDTGRSPTQDPHECVHWFENMERQQREWLPRALAASTAKWKIVVEHHKPAGGHASWLRGLLSQHNVQLVVGSHTHEMAFFNYYNSIGKPLLVVGAGGGAQVAPGCGGATYCGHLSYGFSEVEITSRQMNVKIHRVQGDTPLSHYICESGREQSHPC